MLDAVRPGLGSVAARLGWLVHRAVEVLEDLLRACNNGSAVRDEHGNHIVPGGLAHGVPIFGHGLHGLRNPTQS